MDTTIVFLYKLKRFKKFFVLYVAVCAYKYDMDKQKSYGKNYDDVKLKHRFSLRFFLGTIFACVAVVVIVSVSILTQNPIILQEFFNVL